MSATIKHQRVIETLRVGPLEVCPDPALLYWHGMKQNVRPAIVRFLAALIELGTPSREDVSAWLGLTHPNSFNVRLAELRATLAAASLPIRIVAVRAQEGRVIDHYRLEFEA